MLAPLSAENALGKNTHPSNAVLSSHQLLDATGQGAVLQAGATDDGIHRVANAILDLQLAKMRFEVSADKALASEPYIGAGCLPAEAEIEYRQVNE